MAALLAAAMAWQAGIAAALAAEDVPRPCLIVKLASPEIRYERARSLADELEAELAGLLDVRWVHHPAFSGREARVERSAGEAAAADLAPIARKRDEALARMEKLETVEAARLLSEAGNEAAGFLATEAGAALLCDILLARAVLLVWEGNRRGAEDAMAKVRALRPGFVPDPARYSPAFREAWRAVLARDPAPATLVVRSNPDGASISIDGARRGTTPATLAVRPGAAVRVQVEREGFVPAARTARGLPGETAAVEVALEPDRRSTLADSLARVPAGAEAARIVSRALEEAGAERAAVLVFREIDGRVDVEVTSGTRGAGALRVLGPVEWGRGQGGGKEAALRAARLLVSAGWPASPKLAGERVRPWYYKWWFWGLLGVAAAGVAVAVSGDGGGGGSGSSDSGGSIGVNF